ncbi:MAG: hypothetical protein H8D23_18965 [Candidatus Brocadiales bacterium]|nr:hypothetical protein [Candidatus Brocadiales bacterium]
MAFSRLTLEDLILEPLRGQYYYNRYGMDISNKLGESITYWTESMPHKLEQAVKSEDWETVREISNHLKELGRQKNSRYTTMRNNKDHNWPKNETTLDYSLKYLLASLAEPELDQFAMNLVQDDKKFSGVQIGNFPGDGNGTCEPDLTLFDGTNAIFIEIKVQHGNHNYDATQLLRYLQLINFTKASGDIPDGGSITHIMLMPGNDLDRFTNGAQWIDDIADDGLLSVNVHGLEQNDPNNIVNSPEILPTLENTRLIRRTWEDLSMCFGGVNFPNNNQVEDLGRVVALATNG